MPSGCRAEEGAARTAGRPPGGCVRRWGGAMAPTEERLSGKWVTVYKWGHARGFKAVIYGGARTTWTLGCDPVTAAPCVLGGGAGVCQAGIPPRIPFPATCPDCSLGTRAHVRSPAWARRDPWGSVVKPTELCAHRHITFGFTGRTETPRREVVTPIGRRRGPSVGTTLIPYL